MQLLKVTRDHPRIRGEHGSWIPLTYTIAGSSPHTRGARTELPSTDATAGIIPAYAGSTPPRPEPPGRARDHPRIRGEHFAAWDAGRLDMGSSPHTRGARILSEVVDGEHGIIPAYAGSTNYARDVELLDGDHPRIRGEHTARPPAWLALKSRRGLSYVVYSGYAREKGSSRPLIYEARQHSFRRPGKPFIPQSISNGRGICHMDKKRKPGALETIIRLTPKRAGLARKDETVFPSARILIQALQLITNQTQSRYLGLP